MDVEQRSRYDSNLDSLRAASVRRAGEAMTSQAGEQDLIDRITDGTASIEEVERFQQQVSARVAHDHN
jgi:hypothetical protein